MRHADEEPVAVRERRAPAEPHAVDQHLGTPGKRNALLYVDAALSLQGSSKPWRNLALLKKKKFGTHAEVRGTPS